MFVLTHFFSFQPCNFDSQIYKTYALEYISLMMTANLSIHNLSKGEFLVIGLKQQLLKSHNSSLSIIHPTIHSQR